MVNFKQILIESMPVLGVYLLENNRWDDEMRMRMKIRRKQKVWQCADWMACKCPQLVHLACGYRGVYRAKHSGPVTNAGRPAAAEKQSAALQ
jgi:hypothetical protein